MMKMRQGRHAGNIRSDKSVDPTTNKMDFHWKSEDRLLASNEPDSRISWRTSWFNIGYRAFSCHLNKLAMNSGEKAHAMQEYLRGKCRITSRVERCLLWRYHLFLGLFWADLVAVKSTDAELSSLSRTSTKMICFPLLLDVQALSMIRPLSASGSFLCSSQVHAIHSTNREIWLPGIASHATLSDHRQAKTRLPREFLRNRKPRIGYEKECDGQIPRSSYVICTPGHGNWIVGESCMMGQGSKSKDNLYGHIVRDLNAIAINCEERKQWYSVGRSKACNRRKCKTESEGTRIVTMQRTSEFVM
jgi:hypothetical protein